MRAREIWEVVMVRDAVVLLAFFAFVLTLVLFLLREARGTRLRPWESAAPVVLTSLALVGVMVVLWWHG